MTLEEKREKIRQFCGSGILCDECPLYKVTMLNEENCFTEPAEIERNYAILFPSKAYNPYWERINALAQKQRAKGITKYGVGLENNPADILERINHLQEELIDGLMYCEWIKEKLTSGENL